MYNKSKKIVIIISILLLILTGCDIKDNEVDNKSTLINTEETIACSNKNIDTENKVKIEKDVDKNKMNTTNLTYEDTIFKVYTPDNKSMNGLIRVEYKGVDFGIIFITKIGTNNMYKYIIYDDNPVDILVTEGNGEYNIIGYSVTPTNSGSQSIVGQTEEIQYYLNAEELNIYKLSSSLVNYKDNEEYLIQKYNEIITEYEQENSITLNKDIKSLNIVLALFEYFTTFEYDIELADKISSGEVNKHIVNIVDTIESKRGICIDSSSSLAAMLRVKGYPTKLVYGYYNNSNQYHSWIEVYIDNKWYTLDSIMNKSGIVLDVSTYRIDKIH